MAGLYFEEFKHRLRSVDLASLSVQIWKTFGLSHPSRSAEWLKINRRGSSSERSFSLSRMMRSYVSTSAALSPRVSLGRRLLSTLK